MGLRLKLIVTALFVLLVCSAGQAQTFTPQCAGVNDTAKFTSLTTASSPNDATVRVPYKANTAQRCAVNTSSSPSRITLDFTNGAIKINAGQTLNIAGPIIAPVDRQVFYGPGTVTFTGNTTHQPIYAAWFGVTGDGVERSAELQATVAAAQTKVIAVIKLPAGTVLLNGALSGAVGYQSVIRFVNPSLTTVLQQVTLEGAGEPAWISETVDAAITFTTQGTVLKSTGDGGAILGGDSAGDFTRVELTLRNIAFRTKDNPTRTAVDGSWMFGVHWENLSADTGMRTFQCAQPTTTTAYAFKTPRTNNGAHTVLRNVIAQCYYTGFTLNEHFDGDNLYAVGNMVGAETLAGYHNAHVGRFLFQSNNKQLVATGTLPLTIESMGVEPGGGGCQSGQPAYQTQVKTIDDPSNVLFGSAKIHVNTPCTNVVAFPVVTGAFYFNTPIIAPILLSQGTTYMPFAEAFNNANISIPNDTSTNVTFNTHPVGEYWGIHSISTNTNRFICTKAGIATMTLSVAFAANATGVRVVKVWKHFAGSGGGEDLLAAPNMNATAGGVFPTRMTATVQGVCSIPGDYFYFQVHQDSGGALNLLTETSDSPLATFSIAALP